MNLTTTHWLESRQRATALLLGVWWSMKRGWCKATGYELVLRHQRLSGSKNIQPATKPFHLYKGFCSGTDGEPRFTWKMALTHTHTHTHLFNVSLSGTTWVSRYKKAKTNLDLLKQEIVSSGGISWAVCNLASAAPAHHDSVVLFYRPDALPASQPTALKHWRQKYGH